MWWQNFFKVESRQNQIQSEETGACKIAATAVSKFIPLGQTLDDQLETEQQDILHWTKQHLPVITVHRSNVQCGQRSQKEKAVHPGALESSRGTLYSIGLIPTPQSLEAGCCICNRQIDEQGFSDTRRTTSRTKKSKYLKIIR